MDVVKHTFNIVLEPITPTHVWNGVRSVLGLDLVIDGSKYCVVDVESIELGIDEVSDIFSKRVDVRELTGLVGKLYREGKVRCKRVYDVDLKTSLQGVSEVKLINDLLIPGSALKGYIRTAILNYLLTQDLRIKGLDYVKQLLDANIDLSADPKYASLNLESYYLRAPRFRTQRGFIDLLQSLLVSDVVKSEGVGLCIRDSYIYDLTGKLIARLIIETLDKGSLHYKVDILKLGDTSITQLAKGLRGLEKKFLDILALIDGLKLYEPEKFLEILRTYSGLVIKDELGKVSKFSEVLKRVGIDVSGYAGLLNDLLRSVYVGRCVPIRIGFMTSHKAKTIDSFLSSNFRDKYDELCSVMSQRYHHLWDDSTLKLVWFNKSFYGLGWVRLCVV